MVVPGHVGVRNIKWLNKVGRHACSFPMKFPRCNTPSAAKGRLSRARHATQVKTLTEEAEGVWQRGMAYKSFGPSVTSLDGIDVGSYAAMQARAAGGGWECCGQQGALGAATP